MTREEEFQKRMKEVMNFVKTISDEISMFTASRTYPLDNAILLRALEQALEAQKLVRAQELTEFPDMLRMANKFIGMDVVTITGKRENIPEDTP